MNYADVDDTTEEKSKTDYSHLTQSLIIGTTSFTRQFDERELAKLASHGIKLGEGNKSNYLNLNLGNIVFTPKQDITVNTHEGQIYIAAGASALVMENGHDVAIFNLTQSKPRQVRVAVDGRDGASPPGREFVLEAGQMVVLSRQDTKDFEKLSGEFKAIGYRDTKEYDINDNIKAFVADFSIPSAFMKVAPLKSMLKSNDKSEQALLQELIKTAVMLNDFSRGAGPFKNGEMAR
jgi:hypothetical protein